METGGNWNNREQEIFVNVNEMFAVKFSLIFFASDYKKINVQINIGNNGVNIEKVGYIS